MTAAAPQAPVARRAATVRAICAPHAGASPPRWSRCCRLAGDAGRAIRDPRDDRSRFHGGGAACMSISAADRRGRRARGRLGHALLPRDDLGERIVADFRGDFFRHLTTLDPKFFDAEKTGEIVSRLSADTTQLKATFGSSASLALRNIFMFVGAVAMMVGDQPQTFRLCAGGDSAHRAAALRGRPLGARALRRAQETLAEATAFATRTSTPRASCSPSSPRNSPPNATLPPPRGLRAAREMTLARARSSPLSPSSSPSPASSSCSGSGRAT